MTTILALAFALLTFSTALSDDALASVRVALWDFRAADYSQDLPERLRLQRELVNALTGAMIALQHDPSPTGEEGRQEVAEIWLELEPDSSLPGNADTAALFESLASRVAVLREAVEEDDADQALTAQAELLRDSQLLESMYRFVPTPSAQRARSALEHLRMGLVGDARSLDDTGSEFSALAEEAPRLSADTGL